MRRNQQPEKTVRPQRRDRGNRKNKKTRKASLALARKPIQTAKAKKNFQFEQLDSIQGHDSFLVDEDRFSKVIRDFFRN